jgi:hypothetical protein
MKNPSQSDFERAGLYGMGNFQGDQEVAEDIGIAIDPEALASHIESGRKVANLIGGHALEHADVAARDSEEHASLEKEYGRVTCGNCLQPGCPGCGR